MENVHNIGMQTNEMQSIVGHCDWFRTPRPKDKQGQARTDVLHNGNKNKNKKQKEKSKKRKESNLERMIDVAIKQRRDEQVTKLAEQFECDERRKMHISQTTI